MIILDTAQLKKLLLYLLNNLFKIIYFFFFINTFDKYKWNIRI